MIELLKSQAGGSPGLGGSNVNSISGGVKKENIEGEDHNIEEEVTQVELLNRSKNSPNKEQIRITLSHQLFFKKLLRVLGERIHL